MSKELPKSYKIKALCLNCNNIDELTIPYGVEATGERGIYLSNDNYEYYNLETNEFQSTAYYPRCSKCGSISLKKSMHIENEVKILEENIDRCYDQLMKIKQNL